MKTFHSWAEIQMLLLPIKTATNSSSIFVKRKSSPNVSNVQQFVTDVK